jgi:hypothetical protein
MHKIDRITTAGAVTEFPISGATPIARTTGPDRVFEVFTDDAAMTTCGLLKSAPGLA